ncbi:MAG: VanZ family protein [Ruminococcaceae bacterium]|nr:VanZ family protein [Oscillospiraceae bacterium]
MRKIGRWVVLAAAILGCLYIWHFSMADGERSAITSGKALAFLNQILSDWGISFQFAHITVRKIGHFIGYFILGSWVSLTLWLFEFTHYRIISLPLCFLVACADESIQKFFPGRVASFRDVLLDSAGAACGILLFSCTVWALSALFAGRRKKIEK